MFQLNIKQEFKTDVSSLFRAWSNIEVLKRWFAPGNMTVAEATAQVKEGGQYRIVMQDDDGSQFIVGGQYKEVVTDQRLVFTWQWENSPNITLVTILFSALDAGRSALELVHSEFADEEQREKHQQGWYGCLANLAPVFNESNQTEKA
ncbi:MAG: SRPBCC domain-containing protein [Psychrosphaera sp.]|nr:SRPBCC domain-containing protein [Psychrosphaera sp.]